MVCVGWWHMGVTVLFSDLYADAKRWDVVTLIEIQAAAWQDVMVSVGDVHLTVLNKATF